MGLIYHQTKIILLRDQIDAYLLELRHLCILDYHQKLDLHLHLLNYMTHLDL
uniref:Uncharacterized protein n=1 Tax=virus sp. ctrcb4 TaxID=2825824 RepID=A0A8S5RPA3_9VIRU|nr:MAG TPA: hypothetical protein [virus sp. ctrcb4]DAR12770.1 MAG TPA: hypothetical protein [Crassvirales sp.]